MNFKLILLLMLLLITGSLMAQHRGLPVFETRHKNVYGELFGSHILTGANFDMRLKKGRHRLSCRYRRSEPDRNRGWNSNRIRSGHFSH